MSTETFFSTLTAPPPYAAVTFFTESTGSFARFLLLVLDMVNRDQRVGVFLARLLDDLPRAAPFDQLAVAQHHDLVRHLGHHGKIMGDVERGDAGIADGVLDRRQHIDLGGHVERGGGFVEDDQVWLRAERHGGHDTLQLAAGNLVRETLADVFRDWAGQAS